MSFFYGGYSEQVRERVSAVLDMTRGYSPEMWIGDSYGPQRDSVSVRLVIPEKGTYIVIDPNDKFFKIGFYRSSDIDGSNGIIFDTKISELTDIEVVVKKLLDIFY